MAPTRLLVLGAGEGHQTAFATWIRAGLRITLVDGFSKPRYEFLSDEFHPLDVRRADPLHSRYDPDLADHLVRLAEDHDGVVALTEECAGVAPLIAERAGLPGAGLDAARIARDKYLQRASLERAGLRVPRYAELRSPEALLRFLVGAGGPVVIKPVDSGGSASVRLVRRPEEATAAWERAVIYSGSGRCIAEEFIEGPEISVEAAVQGGLVKRVAVTRKELAGPEFFLERGHLVSPADELDGLGTRAVQRLVDAHGIRDAFLHAEYRISEGELVNIEFAARPGGGHIMDLVLRSRGWNPYAAQARLALGQPVDDGESAEEPFEERHAAIHFLIATGFVRAYAEQAPLVAGLPRVETVSQSVREGRTLPFPEAGWHRAGLALGTGPEPDELRNQLRTAVGRLARAMGVTEIGDRRVSEFPTGTEPSAKLPVDTAPPR